jgi:hypothetical protein
MSLRLSTEYEIAGHPSTGSFIDPSCRRRPASRGERGWIPAFAGMTEASCQSVTQFVPAQVFSKKDTKSMKLGTLNIRILRVLRELRDAVDFLVARD